jgi:opacity protein-like surface antigen
MSNLKSLALGATLAIASIGAFAQAAAPATPRVDAREARQEARIDAGVASGQLNAREARRLEKQQVHVAAVETRAKEDGTVTAGERRHLAKVQTRSSANIYHQKHDAQIVPPMTAKP